MSVELADKNGSMGQAATNSGFKDARDAVDSVFDSGEGLALKAFFENGKTMNTRKCATQAALASRKVKDTQVKSVLSHLAQMLEVAEDFAVIQI